jgi:AcrR family transcriptional regulator
LLAAGLAEFAERGYGDVTVDDIARRADTSHGTFYLYFANKDDFFGVLSRNALRAMETLADEFPVVTPSQAGKSALKEWVASFCDTYAAHAPVFNILAQADLVGQKTWADGFATLLRLADSVALGMTAGAANHGSGTVEPTWRRRLDAVALLMMLERVNYLLANGIRLPREEMTGRLTGIILAAFHTHSPAAAAPAVAGSSSPASRC